MILTFIIGQNHFLLPQMDNENHNICIPMAQILQRMSTFLSSNKYLSEKKGSAYANIYLLLCCIFPNHGPKYGNSIDLS